MGSKFYPRINVVTVRYLAMGALCAHGEATILDIHEYIYESLDKAIPIDVIEKHCKTLLKKRMVTFCSESDKYSLTDLGTDDFSRHIRHMSQLNKYGEKAIQDFSEARKPRPVFRVIDGGKA